MTLLYLIRHARSTWNAAGRMQGQADPPLDEAGRAQAQALAERLKDETFHAVYSSPLARARETAEILIASRAVQPPLVFDDRLMERHLGEWTGLTGDEARDRFPENGGRDWRVDGPPGGESQAELTGRAAEVVGSILAVHPDQAVAIVSHGGTLNAYLAYLLGIPPEKPVGFRFSNCSLARLSVRGENVYLLSLGEESHLEGMRN
ncbi:MAG: histidine phosphatase family protein [Chloroflexi bacterium]|nr:histidine phosphatase family protein [Chloroflexota bacterium]